MSYGAEWLVCWPFHMASGTFGLFRRRQYLHILLEKCGDFGTWFCPQSIFLQDQAVNGLLPSTGNTVIHIAIFLRANVLRSNQGFKRFGVRSEDARKEAERDTLLWRLCRLIPLAAVP